MTRPPALCLDDVAARAAATLSGPVWDYVEGASGGEDSLAANRAAFDAVRIVPRVLRDVSDPTPAAELCAAGAPMPVAIAPMAYQRLVHPEGELAVARAAKAAGVPFVVPLLSSVPVEELAQVGAVLWFQMYWLRDRGATADLVSRAELAGCRAILLTVDVPRMGRRLRDIRNEFALPPEVTPANLTGYGGAAHRQCAGRSAVAMHTELAFDPSLSWRDVAWLRSLTRLPLVLKGVLDPHDAARAADEGVDGVVVSNHGGRQLDGVVPAIDALPPVRDAVAGRCEILLDSGVRGGVDVLRAVARGASGVLLGRPVLWGLADGEPGVAAVLSLVYEELVDAMVQANCHDLSAVRALRLRSIPPAHTGAEVRLPSGAR